MRLSGKNAIITGGAGAIGREVARRFLEEGANVVLFENNQKAMEGVIDELNGLGNIDGIVGDVTDESSVSVLPEKVKKTFKNDRIDILANIAGIAPYSKLMDVKTKDFERTIDINLTGVFLTSQIIARTMITHGGGSIINMSSSNGIRAEEGLIAYNASKAGVILLSKSMALELAPYKIRVNSVCPGFIRTKLQDEGGLPKDLIKNYISKIPLGRYGEPIDVANVFVYLASDESSFITGTEILIDGGQLCQE